MIFPRVQCFYLLIYPDPFRAAAAALEWAIGVSTIDKENENPPAEIGARHADGRSNTSRLSYSELQHQWSVSSDSSHSHRQVHESFLMPLRYFASRKNSSRPNRAAHAYILACTSNPLPSHSPQTPPARNPPRSAIMATQAVLRQEAQKPQNSPLSSLVSAAT